MILKMQKMIKVSNRIQTIASMVDKNAIVADIGTDHCFLPIYLVQSGKVNKCYASDINEGPLSAAKKNVAAYNLEDKINLKLADGISQLESDVTTVTISAMGGSLMTNILSTNKNKLTNVNTIICQPNVGAFTIRKWLVNNDFMIVDEKIFKEAGRFYEVIKAIRGEDYLTDQEILFGPCLLKEMSPVFIEKWTNELAFVSSTIRKIPRGSDDYNRLRAYKANIEQMFKSIQDLLG